MDRKEKQDLIVSTNDTNQNVTNEWRDYDETSIDQAAIDAIVRSRILGLFMLQNIIIKLKQNKKNATEEHQMNDGRIIIIDYRVNPNNPKTVTVLSDIQENNETTATHFVHHG